MQNVIQGLNMIWLVKGKSKARTQKNKSRIYGLASKNSSDQGQCFAVFERELSVYILHGCV